MKSKLAILSLLAMIFCMGCDDDEKGNQVTQVVCDGSTPTWEGEMSAIIATNCVGSGCHGSNSQDGDYTFFAGIAPDLNNGKFSREVLDRQTMPPSPDKLSASDLSLIRCWMDTGFPEK